MRKAMIGNGIGLRAGSTISHHVTGIALCSGISVSTVWNFMVIFINDVIMSSLKQRRLGFNEVLVCEFPYNDT